MNYLPVFATHISPVLNPSGAADQHVGHFLPFHINHQKLGDSGVYSLLISTKHLVFFNREDFKSKKKKSSIGYKHIRIFNFFLLPDIGPKVFCV